MIHEIKRADNQMLDMARKATEYERILDVIKDHYYIKYGAAIDVACGVIIGIYGDKSKTIYKAKPHERLSDLLQWLFDHEEELK